MTDIKDMIKPENDVDKLMHEKGIDRETAWSILQDRKEKEFVEKALKKKQFNDAIAEETKQLQKQELLQQYQVFYKDENSGNIRVNCPRLAKLILRSDGNHFLVPRDTQEILWYNGSYYDKNGETIVYQRTNYYLDDVMCSRYKTEVSTFIKTFEYIDRDKLEQPINLINLKNGIYNIETGELIPHNPKYTFQYELPVEYNKDAKCPVWDKFLSDVLYQEDLSFIQELCGYTLYRGVPWAIITILMGFGRNGKTTFINVISAVLGEKNIEHIPLQTLAHERFAKAKLYTKHANLCSEIGAAEIKDTATLKSLTGGDMIFARDLYQSGFNFRNYAKLISSCNALPDIGDKTLAMTERLAVLEFPNKFPRGSPECDEHLYDKLTTTEELSGILNWMIEGLKRLIKNKTFSKYRDFDNVTDYLKEKQDPVCKFTTQFIEYDANFQIQKEIVYKKYLEYTEKNKMPSLNSGWFGRKFKQFGPHGMSEGQPLKGGHKETWKGVKFKDGSDSSPIIDDKQDFLEV